MSVLVPGSHVFTTARKDVDGRLKLGYDKWGRRVLAAAENAQIFAANRATGHIAFTAAADGACTRRARVQEAGSLRVRFPHGAGDALEAVIVNTGGGMTGGDRFTISLTAEPGAHLIAGAAAAEKIYRSLGSDAEMTVHLAVGAGARLAWLPQETILFDGARLARHIDIELAADATLVMAEALVFGRAAMGEAMSTGSFADRWRVRRDGRLIFADGVLLDGAVSAKLGAAAVTAGGIAIATLLVAPAGDEAPAAVRALENQFVGEVGISAWNGIAVARLVAPDGAALRHDLIAVLAALGQEVPRLW